MLTISKDPEPNGRPIGSASRASFDDTLLLLDYAETAVPPLPKAIRRIQDHAHELNRYPRGLREEATRAFAQAHGLEADQVLLTSGVDEATDLVLLEAGMLTCVTPGFFGYWERAKALNIPTTRVQLNAAWQLPERWYEDASRESAFLVAQPNNPTGSRFDDATWLDQALDWFSIVVVDETYRLVADEPAESCTNRRADNLLTFVSLSKSYGLAGVRIGALIGRAELVARIAQRQRFHAVDSISLHAVIGALEDVDNVAAASEEVRRLRRLYVDVLKEARGLFTEVRTTDCTFVLGRVHDHLGVERLVTEMATHGVRVTDGSLLGLPGWIRVGIADASAIEHLLAVLRRCELALDATSHVGASQRR
jgi:histidinol-phosphate aminotransferase